MNEGYDPSKWREWKVSEGAPFEGMYLPIGADGLWDTTRLLPDEYEFCDGANGTPDLRSEVIRSAMGEKVVPIRRKKQP